MKKLRIPQATSTGYVEIEPGMVFDGSYPSSKTRRGRLQGDGKLCPTITANKSEIYYFEGVYETYGDIDSGEE